MDMSTSQKSVISNTTTQETGHLYIDGFSEGFWAQNVNFLQSESWLEEGKLIKDRNRKRNREGEMILKTLLL